MKSSVHVCALLVVLAGSPAWSPVWAQYNCPVVIDLGKKTVLQAEIVDESRPSTAELWKLLNTLSFQRTKVAESVADPKTVERETLKGDIRLDIAGAGQVRLTELNLVRNRYDASAWVIAPSDVQRILKMSKQPNAK